MDCDKTVQDMPSNSNVSLAFRLVPFSISKAQNCGTKATDASDKFSDGCVHHVVIKVMGALEGGQLCLVKANL